MKTSTFRKTVLTTIPVITFFLFGVFQLTWAPAEERRITPGTVKGDLVVEGDTTLGDATADTVNCFATNWNFPNNTEFNNAGKFIQLKGGLRVDQASTFFSTLSVEGATTIGNAIGDQLIINAGILSIENAATLDIEAALTLDATGQKVSSKGTWEFLDDVMLYGDVWLGFLSTDTVTIYAGIMNYQDDVTINYPGETVINFNDLITFDATGESPLFKGITYDFASFVTNVTVPDANAATEAMNQQTSDGRFFQESEFLQTSAGVGDAGKPVKLDADGNVDASMVNDADVDHTGIGSIGSNTHAQVDTHLGSTSNPHTVTAAQVSAIPTSEKGAANGVATLSAGSLVVENPANATATPGIAKIPISDGSALLDGWVTYAPGGTDVAITDGGTGASTATAGFDALSPSTTKGDIIGFSTTNVRVGVGTDGQFLTANSGAAAGISWANVPTIKSGTVAGGSFAGNPKVFTVTFNTAFPDTNYAVNIEGEDNRTLTFQTKLAGSFVINTNANLAIAGGVDWTATAHNDP